MKNKTIFCTVFLLFFTTLVAQTSTDTLTIRSSAWTGFTFEQNQRSYTFREVPALMQNNQQAYDFIQKARTQNTLANVFGAAGGLLVGWPLGVAVAGGEANWGLATIGAGLIVVAIPIFNSAKRNANRAVQIYNDGVQAQQSNLSINFGVTHQGVGLQINF
ncbi:MAG: hypothetical protein FWC94_06840 [Bacteroidales bacterium]|nr:hypothetical protein [Bacteroidales bacterium]